MVDKTVSGVQPEEQWQGAEYQIAGTQIFQIYQSIYQNIYLIYQKPKEQWPNIKLQET